MGFTAGGSTKGGPLFNATPQTVADLNEARRFAEEVGNRKVGTTTERNAATGSKVWNGLLWGDTTDGKEYIYRTGTGWVELLGDSGWINLPLSAGATVADGLTPRYRVKNGQVQLIGRVTQTGSSIAQLPAYFPSQDLRVLAATLGSGAGSAVLVVSATGLIFTSAGSTVNLTALDWFVG